MNQRKKIEDAAFWDRHICLACGEPADAPDDGDVCDVCSSPDLIPAKQALAAIRLVEDDETPE